MTNPVQLAAMVRSRYTGDEPGYSDRGHDDYWTDFWLTVESENYHSIISHDSIVKQIQE